MLSLRTVATTDELTSLHKPVFVVGVTTAVLVEAGDEHDDAKRAEPAAATNATK